MSILPITIGQAQSAPATIRQEAIQVVMPPQMEPLNAHEVGQVDGDSEPTRPLDVEMNKRSMGALEDLGHLVL